MSAAATEPSPAPWPEMPTEPTDPAPTSAAPTSESDEGPLRTLANQAAASGLASRARENVPSALSPAMSRAAVLFDGLLCVLDASIQSARRAFATDEGRALRSAAVALRAALYAFVAMLAATLLSRAEAALSVRHAPGEDKPPAYARLASVAAVAARRVAARVEKREKEVAGSREAELYVHLRWLAGAAMSLVACVVVALAKYAGPGKDFVVPAAERALALLPHGDSVTDEHVD